MGAGDSETLGEALAAIASADSGEAAGFVAALACAQAAALLELTATLASRRIDSAGMAEVAAEAGRLRGEALGLAALERTAWADSRAQGRPELAVEPARRILALASGISRNAATVADAGDWPFTPDARAAGVLADAAGAIAGLVLAANGEQADGA